MCLHRAMAIYCSRLYTAILYGQNRGDGLGAGLTGLRMVLWPHQETDGPPERPCSVVLKVRRSLELKHTEN